MKFEFQMSEIQKQMNEKDDKIESFQSIIKTLQENSQKNDQLIKILHHQYKKFLMHLILFKNF